MQNDKDMFEDKSYKVTGYTYYKLQSSVVLALNLIKMLCLRVNLMSRI